jgi:phosphate transport system protein
MRTRFQMGLDDLRQKLLRMGGLAEQAVDRARQAYIDRDLTRCQMVLEGETLINTSEREIDEAAFDLLAMQQPMAVDLRFILAVTKINSDLERVGDQAVNIAERVMDMVEMPAADLPVDIARMGAAVSAMVRRALEAFIEGKAELAQAVLEMDNVVDRMKDDAFIQLVKTMNQRPEVVRQALDALLVARNLERVADHATNIAEDVIFWVQGADVRHNASTEEHPETPPGQSTSTRISGI